MKTLLRIDASISSQSNSKALADQFVASWQAEFPENPVIQRDLSQSPPPPLSEEVVGAMYAEEKTPKQASLLALSDELIAELESADVILISTPMYNFGIPSHLKAYFDLVARVGVTFEYTAEGPKGKLNGKSAISIVTSGGDYRQPPLDKMNFVDGYLTTILGFIGINQVTQVQAAGMANSKYVETNKQAASLEIDDYFKSLQS